MLGVELSSAAPGSFSMPPGSVTGKADTAAKCVNSHHSEALSPLWQLTKKGELLQTKRGMTGISRFHPPLRIRCKMSPVHPRAQQKAFQKHGQSLATSFTEERNTLQKNICVKWIYCIKRKEADKLNFDHLLKSQCTESI